MTMQRFLHRLRLPIKNIVRHHTYNDINQLLHHAMEAKAQLAEEAQQKSRFSPASQYTARAPSSPAPVPLEGTPTHPSSSTRPATSGAQSRHPTTTPAASSGLSASVTRHSEKLCRTYGVDVDPFGSTDSGY
jgi:hypothetical protein